MDVIRALNNNAVLCTDSQGAQVICMGKGIGFGRKLGDEIDGNNVEQVFRPSTMHPIANLTALLTEIPLDIVNLVATFVAQHSAVKEPQLLILGLADHISFAIERANTGIEVSYPLVWEVSTLYPDEFALGLKALELVEKETGARLPSDEAAAIAMHFINAQFVDGDMTKAENTTKEISVLIRLVSSELGLSLSPGSPTVTRFITHLRYLFTRLDSPKSEAEAPLHSMLAAIEHDDAEAVRIARKVRSHLEGNGHAINDNELAYIALHVARLRSALST
ncbi:PRD domain-containing protein [Corynebacterium sp. YSMAA1_1_D6]|uniref:PRD domain-containing protein n=1 Tax=unclassified Corynebacterium TaxID=2624378 RepID=UPI0038D20C10